jgi:hypothetical protein
MGPGSCCRPSWNWAGELHDLHNPLKAKWQGEGGTLPFGKRKYTKFLLKIKGKSADFLPLYQLDQLWDGV